MALKVAKMRRATVARAEAMGWRAGRTLRDAGEPTQNPFIGMGQRVPAGAPGALARAWARGYMEGLQP